MGSLLQESQPITAPPAIEVALDLRLRTHTTCSHPTAGQSSQHSGVVSRWVTRATDLLPPYRDHTHPLPGVSTKDWQILHQQHHITANTISIEWNGKKYDIHGVLIILRDHGKMLKIHMHGLWVTANGRTYTGDIERLGKHEPSNSTVGVLVQRSFSFFFSG